MHEPMRRRARSRAASPRPRRSAPTLGDLVGAVGGVGAVDHAGSSVVEVDLDDLVEVARRVGDDLVVGAQVVGDRVGGVGDGGAAGGLRGRRHAGVVGEQRGGGADLGAHVADGGLAGGGDAVGAGAEVLDDGAGAALHGEDAGDLEDDVLRGSRPSRRARR